uniref:CCHC-type domain-containing protein n=1 Tax=Trichogramma kaykai TaxID=54128 RepID=A0ABD2W965_9HYME
MARKTFGMDQYTYQQLLEQIRRRTQGRNEKVAQYIIDLQSTLNKLRPQLDIQTQLDYLHGGMLPELQKMVRRKCLRFVDDLFDEAVEAENTIIRAEQYRAPIQDETVWPELRYQADKNESSYKLAAMPDHKEEITSLIKSQIEVTQLLTNSIRESEKRQAEALQQISKSITELQMQKVGFAGKPEGQKNAQPPKNAEHNPTKQPSSMNSKSKKTKEIYCYGCGAQNVFKKNCPKCSGNAESRE